MTRKMLINLIVFFILVTSMVIYYWVDTRNTERIIERLDKEYHLIKTEDQVKGKVSRIYHPEPEHLNDDPHQAYFILNDSIKMSVKAGDEFNTMASLDSLMGLGDRLFKRQGGDTLVVYHYDGVDTQQYKFQLRDNSGYPFRLRKK